MDLKSHPTSSSSSTSRSFLSSTRSWLPGGGENQKAEDTIGPLGLNTLYVPSSGPANADLIFVHGLGGGSRKTWTKPNDRLTYWPKEWLPNDEAIQDVRIHSFGYDSNWGKKSNLGIHDFANALLSSILHCPSIPQDTKVCSFSVYVINYCSKFPYSTFRFRWIYLKGPGLANSVCSLQESCPGSVIRTYLYLRGQLLISD